MSCRNRAVPIVNSSAQRIPVFSGVSGSIHPSPSRAKTRPRQPNPRGKTRFWLCRPTFGTIRDAFRSTLRSLFGHELRRQGVGQRGLAVGRRPVLRGLVAMCPRATYRSVRRLGKLSKRKGMEPLNSAERDE
jgi:hypothetical protein